MSEINKEREASRLTNILSIISGTVLFFMMLLTVLDVFLRYAFNSPLLGVHEITEFMMVTFVFFSLAYAEVKEDHIRVEFVMDRLPEKFRKITGKIVLIVEIILLLSIATMGIIKAIRVKEMGHISGILSIPVYPFYLTVVLGSFAMAYELVREFIRKTKENNKEI